MPIQTPRLQMYAMGVSDDAPSDEIRQKLVDGIHLRWFFERNLGFPRYGFYLFRRRAYIQSLDQRQCLRIETDGLPAGPSTFSFLDTSLGRLASDVNLQLTDEFGWRWSRAVWTIGRIGFDLAGRQFLRLTLPEQIVGRGYGIPLGVDVKIGLRQNHGAIGERIEFWRRPAGHGPNPLVEKGVTFRVLREDGVPRGRTEITVEDRGLPPAEPLAGLAVYTSTEYSGILEISLPLPAAVVFLTVSGMNVSIEGFAEDGRSVGSQTRQFAEGSYLNAVSLLTREPMRRVVVKGVNSLHTFTFETAKNTEAGVLIKALHGDVEVARTLAQGLERQVVTCRLRSDLPITAVEIDAGPAVLVDLCLLALGVAHAGGWEKIQGFPYPLSLPVTHPDYPASGRRPVDAAAAQSEALARVRYGPPDPWAGEPFGDLHAQLLALVQGGSEPPMVERSTLVPATPVTPPPGPAQAVSLRRYPLDSMLLAALHPALAQMVGLYWVDRTAIPGQAYDYLLLTEWSPGEIPEFASRDPDAVLAKFVRTGAADNQMDGFITFAQELGTPQPPPAPEDVQTFALPGGTMRAPDGGLLRAANVVGLRWDLGKTPSGQLQVDSPVLYHLWRADLGADPGATAPSAERYRCITVGRPVLVGGPPAGAPPPIYENTAWPPFRLHAFERGLADGWYSYQVSGLDIFGRHSGRSAPGQGRRWDPRLPGEVVVHPFAVHLVDRIPPPAPAAVEAWALDPRDPTLLRDAAYETWRASLPPEERDSVLGLRVRWEWPESLMRQAPDVKEFRIYLQSGRPNAVAGRVRAVERLGPRESRIEVEHPPGFLERGIELQVAGRTFRILDIEDGSTLRMSHRLRVDGFPPANAPCALVTPPSSRMHIDYRAATAWQERYYVVGIGEHFTAGVGPDGRPVRRYEVLLHAAGDPFQGGLAMALTPSLADPVCYAVVGVTAADDKNGVPDAAQWASQRWGDRAGNEGAVSPPATVFRVLRDPPLAPIPVQDAERVFATRADYNGHSFYTYRWRPQAHLKVHVFRALDDTLFRTDRTQRFNPEGSRRLDQPTLEPSTAELFPDPSAEPRWNATTREQVTAELNQLNAIVDTAESAAYYRSLSNDGLRILAGLPGNEHAFTQITIEPLDPDDPANTNRLGPDNPDDFVVDPALRAFTDALDGRATNRYFYRAAAVDAAQNRSPLGLSSPPVCLPKVVPPRTPTLRSAAGGESMVTLSWAPNREPDLAEYWILRAEDQQAAADPRTMTLVQTQAVGDVAGQPSKLSWTDSPVPGLTTFYYRLVAVDTNGNVSAPSPVAQARAHDEALPSVPALTLAWSAAAAPADAQVSWTAADDATMLEMRPVGQPVWQAMGGWHAAGSPSLTLQIDATLDWEFRLRVRKYTGALATGAAETLQGMP